METLVQEYGRMAGVSIDVIGNNRIRYRHREVYGVLGLWVSEKKAKALLESTKEGVQQKKLRSLEDAFGPDELVNPFELGIPLK